MCVCELVCVRACAYVCVYASLCVCVRVYCVCAHPVVCNYMHALTVRGEEVWMGGWAAHSSTTQIHLWVLRLQQWNGGLYVRPVCVCACVYVCVLVFVCVLVIVCVRVSVIVCLGCV